jgi:aspartate carbamoyltransferase catalytic subunit
MAVEFEGHVNAGQLENDYSEVLQPFNGDPAGKSLLSMTQLSESDIHDYIAEAYAAEKVVQDRSKRGISLLRHAVMKAVMQQPSTRTGGSCTTAMRKLGGSADLISGMSTSSEAKGEAPAESWVAFATQADIIGVRTAANNGPMFAAQSITDAFNRGQLWQNVPVINLGDGQNEHPTQALGDEFTIHKKFKKFEGLTATVVGDQERYRAHHSFMIGAAKLGMTVIAVESSVARVPDHLVSALGSKLQRTQDLDAAIRESDVLYVGRNPDEYDGNNALEKERSQQLADDFRSWRIHRDRLQQMRPDGMLLHPRPRRTELHPSVDADPRDFEVQQMFNMIPMRMAIIVRALNESLR